MNRWYAPPSPLEQDLATLLQALRWYTQPSSQSVDEFVCYFRNCTVTIDVFLCFIDIETRIFTWCWMKIETHLATSTHRWNLFNYFFLNISNGWQRNCGKNENDDNQAHIFLNKNNDDMVNMLWYFYLLSERKLGYSIDFS